MEIRMLCNARKVATGDAAHYISSVYRLHRFTDVAFSKRFASEDTSGKR
jgi:hypothetical protein